MESLYSIVQNVFKLFRGHSYSHCCDHEMVKGKSAEDNSLEIIKERYAKGEIDKKNRADVERPWLSKLIHFL